MKHEPPYLSMGRRFCVWLELTTDDTHPTFRWWADRLCNDFQATITDEYPPGYHSGSKEYWTFVIGEEELLLMRKTPLGTALGGRDVDLIIRIAEHWSITKRVGWRWMLWYMRKRLYRRKPGRMLIPKHNKAN